MDQIVDIGLPTAIACLGVFFIVLFVDYILNKIWTYTSKAWVRAVIKWTWTMWAPLWPIALGAGGGLVKGLPMPEAVAKLGHVPGLVSVIYGAFCGMISMAVVKQIKFALEKKGIDVSIPDLSLAKIQAKREQVDKSAAKLDQKKSDSKPPSDPPPSDPPEAEKKDEDQGEKDEAQGE